MKKLIKFGLIFLGIFITNSSFAEEVKICTMEYAPVCAKVQVQCIKAPCDPIYETFGNKCMMEANSLATYAYDGECKDEGNTNSGEIINSDTNSGEILNMANPASVKCGENGGSLDLESGDCTFRNGKVCNEWAFFRGECNSNIEIKGIKKDVIVKNERDEMKIDLVYPEITNSTINKTINDYMKNYLDNFKKENSEENTSENWKKEIYSSYEAKYTGGILSIKLNIYTFTGGAHGNTEIKTFNFIAKTGKEIIIKNKNFIKKVSNYSIAYYNKMIDEGKLNSDKDWVKEGLNPKLENFENWMISGYKKEGSNYYLNFDIIFPQYQIAPYSDGIQKITINFKDLK